MDIKIPRRVVPLDLGGYDESLKGEVLYVWVDPPRRLRMQYDEAVAQAQKEAVDQLEKELPEAEAKKKSWLENLRQLVNLRARRAARETKTEDRLLEWFAEIWSQGPAGTGKSLGELRQIDEDNPAYLGWMIAETWRLIAENQERKKKE